VASAVKQRPQFRAGFERWWRCCDCRRPATLSGNEVGDFVCPPLGHVSPGWELGIKRRIYLRYMPSTRWGRDVSRTRGTLRGGVRDPVRRAGQITQPHAAEDASA
jgi:hypothetical protein